MAELTRAAAVRDGVVALMVLSWWLWMDEEEKEQYIEDWVVVKA